MTMPIQSVSTQPQYGLQDWIAILHNATKVSPESPRYAESRRVMQDALRQIRTINETRNAADQPTRSPVGKGAAVLRNVAQTATSGAADEIIGLIESVSGRQPPGAARDVTRQQLAEARTDQPLMSLLGGVGGAVLNPANRILGPATAGLSPASQGFVFGSTLGAAQGFGEATGPASQRAIGAGVGAGIGAVGGTVVGKLVGKLLPIANTIAKNIKAAFGKRVPAAEVQDVTESAIRTRLQQLNAHPDAIERTVQAWRARTTGTPAPAPAPAPPVPRRPGETITQVSPRGFEVTGPRVTPPIPTTPTILEMQGRVPPRAVPPPRQVLDTDVVQKQLATFAEFLRGATPEDLPQRLGTLRLLGVPIPQNAEVELAAFLTRGVR